MGRRSQVESERGRREILARALDLASVEGLHGLTIGRLAEVAGMSKSGLFAQFGSKEALQGAVIEAARELFVREVLSGAPGENSPLEGLAHLAQSWLRYVEKGFLRGGCFFSAASLEVDDRPGVVRDRIVELTRSWVGLLETAAAEAVEGGELVPESDPADLAFEIHAFVQEANWAFQLHGDAAAFQRAARAIRRSLETRATERGLRALADLDP